MIFTILWYYLIFCLSTSLFGIIASLLPVLKTINMKLADKICFCIGYFIASFALAPIFFIVCMVNNKGLKFQLYEIIMQEESGR